MVSGLDKWYRLLSYLEYAYASTAPKGYYIKIGIRREQPKNHVHSMGLSDTTVVYATDGPCITNSILQGLGDEAT